MEYWNNGMMKMMAYLVLTIDTPTLQYSNTPFSNDWGRRCLNTRRFSMKSKEAGCSLP